MTREQQSTRPPSKCGSCCSIVVVDPSSVTWGSTHAMVGACLQATELLYCLSYIGSLAGPAFRILGVSWLGPGFRV